MTGVRETKGWEVGEKSTGEKKGHQRDRPRTNGVSMYRGTSTCVHFGTGSILLEWGTAPKGEECVGMEVGTRPGEGGEDTPLDSSSMNGRERR